MKPSLISISVLLAALLAGARPALGAEDRPTEPLRMAHASLKARLNHLDATVRSLSTMKPEEQPVAMTKVVELLKQHIIELATEEERALYPAVDKAVVKIGAHPFTETMRFEHGIIGRWVKDLDRMACAHESADEFRRKANRLLGLIAAHFETEEEVLLPILDRAMTARQFEKEVLDRMHSES